MTITKDDIQYTGNNEFIIYLSTMPIHLNEQEIEEIAEAYYVIQEERRKLSDE